MTLIINAATPAFVVHASDRLLTKRVGGKTRVHSDVENKTLIVRTNDAICVIGYTGAAYIGDTITDEWIASTITGQDLTERFMMRQPGVRRLRLNTLMRRLEQGLRSLALPGSANFLGIAISGVRQRRGYAMPFLREFERNRGVIRKNGYMRNLRSPQFHILSQIGDHGSFTDLGRCIGGEIEARGLNAGAFRSGMINAIRERAGVSQVVGDEIMTVTISRCDMRWDVVWTFETPRPRTAVLADQEGNVRATIPSFFSPWIISPASIVKPSLGNGHLEHVMADMRIRCGNNERARRSGGVLFGVSSQDRAPRR